MRANKSLRCARSRLAGSSQRRWPALSALILLGGCELADVAVEPIPDLFVAGVTLVATVDPLESSRVNTHATALVTRFHRQQEQEVPGAHVRVLGESGRVLQFDEVSDPLVTCVTPFPVRNGTRPPAGSCHVAFAREAYFAPGERVMLTVTLPGGGVLTGESRMPGSFAPSDISLENGRCRLDPDSGYRFDWTRSEGSWGYLAEARFAGLGELWSRESPLYLEVTLRGADKTALAFPRGFLFELAGDLDSLDLYRALHEGLPEGASAEVAVGAVDRNWANWIRFGAPNSTSAGEVISVPSVFGDGTGWFGTAVRWRLSVESRHANGDDDLPLCGPAVAD